MPKKIDWDSIRQDFIESDLTYTALASRHGVSRQSVEKRGSDEGWQALRQAFRREQLITVEEAEKTDDEFDLDTLLKKAIILSTVQLERAEVRNFEGAADALCKLTEAYSRLHPPTIEDWADQGARFSTSAEVLWSEIKKACHRALGT
jgi:hypothetical protein